VVIRFADCQLDVDARRLVRDDREAHLQPKAFELLKLLVQNRPRVLSKNELIERVWEGVCVSDASLAKIVSKIRQAIGQHDDTSIVRTVHGCGYAFAAEVHEDHEAAGGRQSNAATCWLFCGTREFPLANGEHIVGREVDATVRLDSTKVSRRHAKVVVSNTAAVLIDLGSKNGSFVGGVRVTGPTTLKSGDEVRVGPFALIFRFADESRSTETQAL
jgi:DNA-binding winged helix-turn-helix (wHTH) protein